MFTDNCKYNAQGIGRKMCLSVYLYFAFWFLFLERYNEMTGSGKDREREREKNMLVSKNRNRHVQTTFLGCCECTQGVLLAVHSLCLAYFSAIRHMAERITGTGGSQCRNRYSQEVTSDPWRRTESCLPGGT